MTSFASSTRAATTRFDRIFIGNKFDIKNENDNDYFDDGFDGEQGITFIDTLQDNLEKKGIKKVVIKKLIDYTKEEQFDTEGMEQDINLMFDEGNISKHMINHKQCMDHVINMFNKAMSMYLLIYILFAMYLYLICINSLQRSI